MTILDPDATVTDAGATLSVLHLMTESNLRGDRQPTALISVHSYPGKERAHFSMLDCRGVDRTFCMSKEEITKLRHALGLALEDLGCPAAS